MRIVQVNDRQLAEAVFDVQLCVCVCDGKTLIQCGEFGFVHRVSSNLWAKN